MFDLFWTAPPSRPAGAYRFRSSSACNSSDCRNSGNSCSRSAGFAPKTTTGEAAAEHRGHHKRNLISNTPWPDASSARKRGQPVADTTSARPCFAVSFSCSVFRHPQFIDHARAENSLTEIPRLSACCFSQDLPRTAGRLRGDALFAALVVSERLIFCQHVYPGSRTKRAIM